jgi:hypothetical protein
MSDIIKPSFLNHMISIAYIDNQWVVKVVYPSHKKLKESSPPDLIYRDPDSASRAMKGLFCLLAETDEDRDYIKFDHAFMSSIFRKIQMNVVVPVYLKVDVMELEQVVRSILQYHKFDMIYESTYSFYWYFQTTLRSLASETKRSRIKNLPVDVVTKEIKRLRSVVANF